MCATVSVAGLLLTAGRVGAQSVGTERAKLPGRQPSTTPSQFESDREKLIDVQSRNRRQVMAEKGPIPETRMNQILQFRVEKRQLVVHTPLHAPILDRRADIVGFGMPAELSYTESVPADPESSQLEFTLLDYPDKLTNVRIHVSCQPNTPATADLQIESSLQTGLNGEHFARVVYTQTATRASLQAFGTAASEDQDSQTVILAEKDFSTLREKHPAAMETWLRPVLHRLQQDFVFATDSNAAWQALADEWPQNAKATARLNALLPDLNSPRWQTRNAAEKELAKMGRDGATVVMRRSREGLSLEQNARLDEILARFKPMTAEQVKALSMNPEFLLDCEYSDDVVVRRLAAARLAKLLGHPLNFSVDLPDSQRAEAIERTRAQITPQRKADASH